MFSISLYQYSKIFWMNTIIIMSYTRPSNVSLTFYFWKQYWIPDTHQQRLFQKRPLYSILLEEKNCLNVWYTLQTHHKVHHLKNMRRQKYIRSAAYGVKRHKGAINCTNQPSVVESHFQQNSKYGQKNGFKISVPKWVGNY